MHVIHGFLVVTLVSLTAPVATGAMDAARADAASPAGLSCKDVTTGPVAYTKCSGMLASFDGVLIDSDLTVPLHRLHDRLPLLELLHGGGDNKNQFEAETPNRTGVPAIDDFNNVWFASRGYAVLTTTSR